MQEEEEEAKQQQQQEQEQAAGGGGSSTPPFLPPGRSSEPNRASSEETVRYVLDVQPHSLQQSETGDGFPMEWPASFLATESGWKREADRSPPPGRAVKRERSPAPVKREHSQQQQGYDAGPPVQPRGMFPSPPRPKRSRFVSDPRPSMLELKEVKIEVSRQVECILKNQIAIRQSCSRILDVLGNLEGDQCEV